MDSFVRISEIELTNFKNVKHGIVKMSSVITKTQFNPSADILGIYGQNGSGKTAVIEAMAFVQMLLIGESLPESTEQYILKDVDTATIAVTFAVVVKGESALVHYTVTLKRVKNEGFQIDQESIKYRLQTEHGFKKVATLLEYHFSDSETVFSPKTRYDAITSSKLDNWFDLVVAKKMAKKSKTSFIFNQDNRKIFSVAYQENAMAEQPFLNALHRYALLNLFVISNEHASTIGMKLILPVAFRLEEDEHIAKGDIAVLLNEPTVVGETEFKIVEKLILDMNSVLGTIIPGLSLKIYDFGEQLMKDEEKGRKFELISKRGDIEIPLKYESEGIIKIISILNVLMCVYNHPSMCLLLDELDAGIYEYLLGEMLYMFENGAQGQLIFTSHNLRVLELLNSNNLIFSTANPENRYIRLPNIKSSNNLRDVYLRSLLLGGQKESLYTETDRISMGRAFRRFGKAVADEA